MTPTGEVLLRCRFSVIDQQWLLAGLATDEETARVERGRDGVGRDRDRKGGMGWGETETEREAGMGGKGELERGRKVGRDRDRDGMRDEVQG